MDLSANVIYLLIYQAKSLIFFGQNTNIPAIVANAKNFRENHSNSRAKPIAADVA